MHQTAFCGSLVTQGLSDTDVSYHIPLFSIFTAEENEFRLTAQTPESIRDS